jgi:hypothetical protein
MLWLLLLLLLQEVLLLCYCQQLLALALALALLLLLVLLALLLLPQALRIVTECIVHTAVYATRRVSKCCVTCQHVHTKCCRQKR